MTQSDQLSLVRVQFESVSGHPATNIDDALLEPSDCRGDVFTAEMFIQAPKMGFLGDFGPLNVIIHHRDPKRHIPA